MIESKKINMIIGIAVIFALVTSIVLVTIGNIKDTTDNLTTEVAYETEIFGEDIISIEIIADEDDWQEMLDNAINEQYIMVDVIVNGTKFENVGIRPKGNSSLMQVVNMDSDRYSFRLKFDEYIDGQTCFGLDSFVINNMYTDNTYMKEYISYELMEEIGVDVPYFGYSDITVNGENWGLYLAVELYNDSYEQRVFGDTSGLLYNVKNTARVADQSQGQGENAPIMPEEQEGDVPTIPEGQQDNIQRPRREQDSENMGEVQAPLEADDNNISSPDMPPNTEKTTLPPQMEGGRKEMNSGSGGTLEYIDDNTENYSDIFNNVVGKGSESDFKRVIEALEALSQGEELESYFDVDQILRYLAAHTIVVNLDSYSSNMAQNYYIYENDGKITILPWDYNQAWGGFQSNDASSVINFPIDTPLSGVEMSSRPLIEKLFANEEYLERYHNYLQELLDKYFLNNQFEDKINTLDALISDYVKDDSTAFCTYDEYKKAVSSFITLGNLRAQSVQGQLDGVIPSTTEGQNTNPEQLISAEGLNLSELSGTMDGKGNNNRDIPQGMNNGMDMELMNKARDIIQQANGNITEEIKEELISLGLTTQQIEQLSAMGNNALGGVKQRTPNENRPNLSNENMLESQGMENNNLILIGILFLVLIVAIVFVVRFKRNY